MTDMKMTPKEAKESVMCCPGESEGPRYPYGLQITLDEESLDKLGVGKLPAVGDKITLSGTATVTSISENESQDTPSGQTDRRRSVGLQITDFDWPAAEGGTEKHPAEGFYNKAS